MLGEDAIEIIVPEHAEKKQAPPEKNETWKKSERNPRQSVQPDRKRFMQSERGQLKTTASQPDSIETRVKPEKWVQAKPEKPKIKINVRVEALIKRDFEEIMKKAHQIVKDTHAKIHPEINENTKVLDSIVFELSSSKERDAFKERIARAEKKVFSCKLEKDIEEPSVSTLRVSSQFIRDNKKLIDAIIKEIESPEINLPKAGFFKKTASTKERSGLLLGSQKPGSPITKEPPH